MADRPSRHTERKIDEALNDSFPASDPPPMSGSHAGGPKRKPDPPDSNKDSPTVLTPEQARQGMIVLRTPLRRWLFVGGLVLAFVVLIGLSVVEYG